MVDWALLSLLLDPVLEVFFNLYGSMIHDIILYIFAISIQLLLKYINWKDFAMYNHNICELHIQMRTIKCYLLQTVQLFPDVRLLRYSLRQLAEDLPRGYSEITLSDTTDHLGM